MGPIELGVNIDHVATLRQARGTSYPDPVQAAEVAERAGADGITVHLREDRRHIQDQDLERLRDCVGVRLNLELAVSEEMLAIAERVRPSNCCFVPERRAELTTEGGLDLIANLAAVRAACDRMSAAGIVVSLFIDPEPAQIETARALGVPAIELHTGRYADAREPALLGRELERLKAAARLAHGLGLQVNAGHGLHYDNVKPVAAIPEVLELNIGHAIVARALFIGLEAAVRQMKQNMDEARQ